MIYCITNCAHSGLGVLHACAVLCDSSSWIRKISSTLDTSVQAIVQTNHTVQIQHAEANAAYIMQYAQCKTL